MVPYYEQVIETIISILSSRPEQETKWDSEREEWILKSLVIEFANDPGPAAASGSVRLLSLDVFERLVPVLVDLLVEREGESEKAYMGRVKNFVTPAIVRPVCTSFGLC